MGSYIISGQTDQERLARALEIVGKNSSGVDLVILDEAKGIDSVREIKASLSRKPYQSKQISMIVPQADSLSPEAQNALLKTLEEPAGDSNLILLCQNPNSLLPTVRSRCLTIDLGPGSSEISERELKTAWQYYKRGNLADLYDISGEAKPAVWAELGRQVLLYQLGGEELSRNLAHGVKLADVAPKVELAEVTRQTDPSHWQNFSRRAQEAEVDLKSNLNRKLVLENMFLDLPSESSIS